MNFKIIKSAKISVKLTLVYAVMFSLVLLILNASILYGIKYYLHTQANKEIEDVKTIVLNRVLSESEHVDLSDKELISEVPSKQNVSIRILQVDGKVLNISKYFYRDLKINGPFDEIRAYEEHNKQLVYKNLKIDTKEYGMVYIQIVKDMDNEYDFLRILLVFMIKIGRAHV